MTFPIEATRTEQIDQVIELLNSYGVELKAADGTQLVAAIVDVRLAAASLRVLARLVEQSDDAEQ